MHLSHLYVKPDEQDHSIGSLTMAEIIKLAARAGLPKPGPLRFPFLGLPSGFLPGPQRALLGPVKGQ